MSCQMPELGTGENILSWKGHLPLSQFAPSPVQPGLEHFQIEQPQLLWAILEVVTVSDVQLGKHHRKKTAVMHKDTNFKIKGCHFSLNPSLTCWLFTWNSRCAEFSPKTHLLFLCSHHVPDELLNTQNSSWALG